LVFWEALPTATTNGYIARLVNSLAHDTASLGVRIATIEGLTSLLDNPLAHVALKGALPHVKGAMHDKSERVRIAMVNLLLKVKTVREIKFYDVVPVDDLLYRLSVDSKSAAVSSGLTFLLLNSYVPQSNNAKQIQRCMTFLKQSKPAALIFYSHLAQHVPSSVVMKLAVMLLKCVLVTGEKVASKENEKKKKEKKGNKKRTYNDTVTLEEDDNLEKGLTMIP